MSDESSHLTESHLQMTDLDHSMACAIREAYAATLTVVILVEDQPHDDHE